MRPYFFFVFFFEFTYTQYVGLEEGIVTPAAPFLSFMKGRAVSTEVLTVHSCVFGGTYHTNPSFRQLCRSFPTPQSIMTPVEFVVGDALPEASVQLLA